MKRRRVGMTLSIPPEIAEDYEKIAEREAKNKSQLFRDMFLLYKEKASEKASQFSWHSAASIVTDLYAEVLSSR